MKPVMRVLLAIVIVCVIGVTVTALLRIVRVNRASAAIPVYPGAREGGGRTRYLPRLLPSDDGGSARVQRLFAFSQPVGLMAIARHAEAKLAAQGWYLVTPDDLERIMNPQVIVWQREPDERLDLSQLWPLEGLTREQRMYGGIFPAEFLDAPLVIEWSWALGGPRSARPSAPSGPILRPIPPPQPRG
jgi:hypothetical protein